MAEDDTNPQQKLGDLFRLTKSYAVQETVEPIKGLSKFIGFGVAAAVVGAVALTLVLLGVLRLIQAETTPHLTGHLSWVPYLATFVVALVLMGIALGSIARRKGKNS